MASIDIWKISPEERANHNTQFTKLNPLNGYITGEQAREYFLKSNLPPAILGQIWNLADLTKDGKLDKKEFSIACFLIKKVLLGVSLPVSLPPSILIEPQQSVSLEPQLTSIQPSLFSIPNTNTMQSRIPLMSTPSPPLQTMTNTFPSINLNTPSIITTTPITIPPIPSTSRNKYLQVFQSNDPTSSGFLPTTQARMLLVQTGLQQQQLAQIWQLSDCDLDGKLSLEEFILAMHLCDYAKTGGVLPSVLPPELVPKSRSSSFNMPSSSLDSLLPPLGGIPTTISSNPNPVDQSAAMMAKSFEDRRKENFEKGNAVLEAKRQMLKEQAEREKREREEKDRIELEKKMKIKEEQERKRLADIEKQLERQRMYESQREEERKKALEQREAARQELLRQQRIEWERQKQTELENLKLKLQETLCVLKAKDKNLEYDMQTLNDKIGISKTRISDTQSTLSELNIQMDSIKKNLEKKSNEYEIIDRHVKDYSENLRKLSQEKVYLTEKLKQMNQDNPFAESYRNESVQYKQEQMNIQQLKCELERLDSDINSLRTQIECLKHTAEVNKNEANDLSRETDRITSLVNLKRNDFKLKYSNSPLVGLINQTLTSTTPTTQSNSLLRSNTPKDNYDAFKEEITKIQQNSSNTTPTLISNDLNIIASITSTSNSNTTASQLNTSANTSTISNINNKTQNLITSPTNEQQNQPIEWSNSSDDPFSKNESNNTFDPFNNNNNNNNSISDPFTAFDTDPFAPVANTNIDPFAANSNDTDPWADFGSNTNNPASAFDDAFDDNGTAAGFGDDESWNTSVGATKIPENSISDQANNNNTFGFEQNDRKLSKSNSSNSISNENKLAASPQNNVKNIVDKFNSSKVLPKQITTSPTTQQANNLLKYRVLFPFEAQREDELTLQEGETVSIDLSVKTDEGWSFGMLKGRTGVFPTAFAVPLTELDAIQEEQNSFNSEPVKNIETSFEEPSNLPQVITIAPYVGKKENHLSFNAGEIIFVREKQGVWWSGELNGKIGWFPQSYVKEYKIPSQNGTNHNNGVKTRELENYYISLFSFESNEPGDLNFGQYELINVVEMDGEWYKGQIEETKVVGIFPSNYVRKFDFPIDYVQKFNIAIALQDYMKKSNEELSLKPHDLIAITQLSPDNQWSYGEVFDEMNQIKRGWFPTHIVDNIIVTKNNSARTTAFSSTNNSIIANTPTITANIVSHSNSNNQISTPPTTTTTTTPTNVASSLILNATSPTEGIVLPQPKTNFIDQVIALYDFQSTTNETISFPKDAIINIISKNGDWWNGEYNGKRGLLPFNYVQSINDKRGSQK